jgi:hypothetical protein
MEGQRQLAGRPLNAPDGMIAATAVEHDLTVVTRNVKDSQDLASRSSIPGMPLDGRGSVRIALREELAFPASVFGPVEVGGMLMASLAMAIVNRFLKAGDDTRVPAEVVTKRLTPRQVAG